MPEKSNKKVYTKEDLKKFRAELLQQKALILDELIKIRQEANKTIKDSTGDLSSFTLHMADMATDLYDREFALELAESERELLYSLDEAIKRIDAGSFGQCEMCDTCIPKQRLNAMPHAQYCISCQEKRETKKRK
ncbi:TraR/DksA family transcriptional regulator [Candidatus Omnitrophus magneticus]|uniref:TraR/DksA family transcriptional regulator n=1 Tax=Candidatus Omnitrophus magneticus TaxID=1609969 RepID=A0A0F0CSU8_9BACT|nr:TraR/DksA family transcriptional regulator [Candidatus Omnitrophus magneticus]